MAVLTLFEEVEGVEESKQKSDYKEREGMRE